jgi:hypothetical protein
MVSHVRSIEDLDQVDQSCLNYLGRFVNGMSC